MDDGSLGKHHGGETKATGRAARAVARLQTRLREQQALALRLTGATLQQVADQLGYASRGAAYKAVERGLGYSAPAESAEALRQEARGRLDRALLAVWPDVVAQGGDWRRRHAAVDAALRIEERRCRLEGLDRPAPIDLDQHARELARRYGLDEGELVRETRRLRAEHRRGRARTGGVDRARG
jgi:hypothetical protein